MVANASLICSKTAGVMSFFFPASFLPSLVVVYLRWFINMSLVISGYEGGRKPSSRPVSSRLGVSGARPSTWSRLARAARYLGSLGLLVWRMWLISAILLSFMARSMWTGPPGALRSSGFWDRGFLLEEIEVVLVAGPLVLFVLERSEEDRGRCEELGVGIELLLLLLDPYALTDAERDNSRTRSTFREIEGRPRFWLFDISGKGRLAEVVGGNLGARSRIGYGV